MASSFTTPGASVCPSGYTLVPGAQSNVIPSSTTAAQLAAEQAAYCQNASGQLLENVQGQPIAIACLIGAALTVGFAPGFLKLAAAPLVWEAYCQMNQQACILSL